MHFCGGRLALEQFHFSLSVLADNVIRCPAPPGAKPFLKLGVPADVVFHRAKLYQESRRMSVRQRAVSWRFRVLRHFTGSRSSNDIAAYASELYRIVWKLGGRRKPREKRNDLDS